MFTLMMLMKIYIVSRDMVRLKLHRQIHISIIFKSVVLAKTTLIETRGAKRNAKNITSVNMKNLMMLVL